MKTKNLKNTVLFNIFHPLYNCYHLPVLENDYHPHHKHTEATICIIFSVSKFAYEKYILHRKKQSFKKKIHLLHKYRGILYFIVSPIFYIQNNTNKNNAHHNKHSLSKQSPHFGHITHYKGQMDKGPSVQ